MPSRTAAALCFACALAACDRANTASYVTSAKSYMAKSDYNAAIIQLENALVKADSGGHAFSWPRPVQTGNAVGGNRGPQAIELKYPPDEAIPCWRERCCAGDTGRWFRNSAAARESPGARADLGTRSAGLYRSR
jgi:hypothetical protein